MTPTDPLFASQWHLLNTDPTGLGLDLNVTGVWNDYTGAGVHVGVIDDGFDLDHPDLPTFNSASYDFLDNDTNIDAVNGGTDNDSDFHGTATAGLIGAQLNGQGVVGVAFGASFSGYRVAGGLSLESLPEWLNDISRSINRAVDHNVDVINISMGFPDLFDLLAGPGANAPLLAALDHAVISGREGLGTIVVKSAGNVRLHGGEDFVYDAGLNTLSNDTRQIIVAAVEQDGALSFYSTRGASVLISAFGTYGQVVTTDVTGADGYDAGDYTSDFNGTSAAAPMVSGVVALMLDANPNLGWRDVQNILAYSARQTPVQGAYESSDWVRTGGNTWNASGLHYSADYGYGLVDALAAVRMAETWQGTANSANQAANVLDFTFAPLVVDNSSATVTASEPTAIDVERVQVSVTFSTTMSGDVEMYLISSDGTEVRLFGDVGRSRDSDRGFSNDFSGVYNFDAQGFRGESSAGTWSLRVVDDSAGDPTTLTDVKMTFFGAAASNNDLYVLTDELYRGAPSKTIADTNGGTDIVNAAAVTNPARIILGATSTIGGTYFKFSGIEKFFLGDSNDTFLGDSAANFVDTGRGNDSLTGGAGRDNLAGGRGDDTYVLAAAPTGEDTIIEKAGGGTDVITSTINRDLRFAGFALIENLSLLGAATTGTGNALVNRLTGSAGDNTLNAIIGTGKDTLVGLDGNDLYTITRLLDVVQESATANAGASDQVRFDGANGQTYVLTNNVEVLTLIGTAATNGTGNASVNTIIGNAAANVLIGAGPAGDVLRGMNGNDTYVIDVTRDTIQEVAGAPAGATDHVKWTGTAGEYYVLGANVELLTLAGGAATNGTGNADANIITGNAAANILTAVGASADRLVGMGGDDTYGLTANNHILVEAAGVAAGTADKVNFNGAAGTTYLLANNIEYLNLLGTAAIHGTGNAGANTITGNAATNVLKGGGGDDVLLGRGGTDTLFGDANDDKFRFLVAGDSVVGAARDVIRDLDDAGLGNDVIDLSTMAGVTSFINAAAFSAPGQVRVQQAGASVLVQINITGNSVAESEILIANATLGAGVGQVDGSDFLL